MAAKHIPLMEVVSQFLDENDKSIGDEDKAWGIAFRGMELMYYNTASEPKTVQMAVLPNKTVVFPSDYVQWCKIGLINEHGKVVPLIVNNALTTLASDMPNRLTKIQGNINNDYWGNETWLNFWNGNMYTPLFGVGHGLENYGECRVDETNNIIILNPDFRHDSIVLEYISTPEKDYDYKIDRRLREPLIAFLNWKFKLGTRQDFYAAYIEGDRMMHPFEVQTFQQVVREGSKFCLKL